MVNNECSLNNHVRFLGGCSSSRLAKKKAQAEVQKRRLEEAQKAEEERLLAKHRVSRKRNVCIDKMEY